MAAYVVMIREKLTDPKEMEAYAALARKARGDVPPKPLAFYGAHEVFEGAPADGVVLLEFPDAAAAKAWYTSPGYQEALQHRLKGAEYRVILVDGFTAPA